MATFNRLDDTTVRYKLYPCINKKSASPSISTSTTTTTTTASSNDSSTIVESLQLFIIESLAYLNPYISRYIWQNEPFNLHVVNSYPGKVIVKIFFCIL